ncbi:MAG: flagellar hook-length control protein FliK [Deferribacteraceae bacterium]|jgi:flagellar hook-length control protein FliK|nr:flagellar hook-length control protein FliK [Deferribacteraceae bacterium]
MNESELALAGLFVFPQNTVDTAVAGVLPVLPVMEETGRAEFLLMLRDALSQLGEEKAAAQTEEKRADAPILQDAPLQPVNNKGFAEFIALEEKISLPLLTIKPNTPSEPLENSETAPAETLAASDILSAESPIPILRGESVPLAAAILSAEYKYILPTAESTLTELPIQSCSEAFISHYKEVLSKAKEILSWLKVQNDEPETAPASSSIKESNVLDAALLEIPLEERISSAFQSVGNNTEKGAIESFAPSITEKINTLKAPIMEARTADAPLKAETVQPQEQANNRHPEGKAPLLIDELALNDIVKGEIKGEVKLVQGELKSAALKGEVINAEFVRLETAKGTGSSKADNEQKDVKAPQARGEETVERHTAAKSETTREQMGRAPQNKTAFTTLADEEYAQTEEDAVKSPPIENEEKGVQLTQKTAIKTAERENILKTDELPAKGGDSSIKDAASTSLTSKTDGKLSPKPAAIEKSLEWSSPKDAVKFAKLVQQAGEAGANRLTVRLIPEHLGKVEVQLTEVNGRLDAKILANSMESKNFLAANAEALTRQLADKGITIDNMDFAFHDSFTKDAHEKSGRERESRANKVRVRPEPNVKEVEADSEAVERVYA